MENSFELPSLKNWNSERVTSQMLIPENKPAHDQTFAMRTLNNEIFEDYPLKYSMGACLKDIPEDPNEEPEEIRADSSNDSLVVEFRERFQKLSGPESLENEKLNISSDNLLDISDQNLPLIEFESPPELDPSILSDEENSPTIPTFPHRNSVYLTRLPGTTVLGNSASPTPMDSDDDTDFDDEIDVLDMLQIKTPTSKMEEDLQEKFKKFGKTGSDNVRRNFMN